MAAQVCRIADRPGVSASEASAAAAALHDRGLALRALGRLDESIAAFRDALALDPDSVATLGCLGNALKAAANFVDASACHLRAAELAPNCEEPWSNLGLTYQAWGKQEAALACLERAVSLGASP